MNGKTMKEAFLLGNELVESSVGEFINIYKDILILATGCHSPKFNFNEIWVQMDESYFKKHHSLSLIISYNDDEIADGFGILYLNLIFSQIFDNQKAKQFLMENDKNHKNVFKIDDTYELVIKGSLDTALFDGYEIII